MSWKEMNARSNKALAVLMAVPVVIAFGVLVYLKADEWTLQLFGLSTIFGFAWVFGEN